MALREHSALVEPAPDAPTGRLPNWIGRRPETVAVVVGLVGLLIQVIGYSRGWQGRSGAIGYWFVGYVVIIAPYIAVLCLPQRSTRQRLGAALGLTLTVYASWLLSNPLVATRFDENLHVTTLVGLVGKAEFFQLNSMLPVSPHFPGLELAAAGVHWLTGFPLFACQVIVVVVARITFVTGLFLLTTRVARSARAGGFAVLVYVASPQFYFFNAQFSYQTVALAMVISVLYLLVRAFDSDTERPWRELLAAQACLAALAITHHLTSWVMLGALWTLAGLFALGRERRRFRLTLITAELATAAVAIWSALIAPLLISYIGPIFGEAGSQLIAIMDGGGQRRQVGVAGDGSSAPRWQLAIMASSVLIWAAVLLPAGWRAWRNRAIGGSLGRYFVIALAISFPLTQAARFSSAAGEVADRASSFIFLGMAIVVGAFLAHTADRVRLILVPVGVIVVLGGTIIGSGPDWQRVPGPYLAGAQQRAIDAETVAAAQWTGRYLPAGSAVAADTTFARLLPNYADVIPVTSLGGYASVTPMFIAERMDQFSLSLILRNDVDFVVVDTRLAGQTPASGCFFDGCGGYGEAASTVTAAMVEKFEDAPGFELVLDGPVRIYDVREVRGVPATFVDRPPRTVPGTWNPVQAAWFGALLIVLVSLRRRVLDPRRFRASHLINLALAIPVAMVIGVVGVPLAFNPVVGSLVASVLVGTLVGATRNPPPAARLGAVGTAWAVLAVVLAAQATALAMSATYQGLLETPQLPPPDQLGRSLP
jgi:hypothetical protein